MKQEDDLSISDIWDVKSGDNFYVAPISRLSGKKESRKRSEDGEDKEKIN